MLQVAEWGPKLGSVTDLFAQLQRIDTSGVDPSLTAAGCEGVHQRDDKSEQHAMAASFLSQVPDTEGDLIKVPKIRTNAD